MYLRGGRLGIGIVLVGRVVVVSCSLSSISLGFCGVVGTSGAIVGGILRVASHLLLGWRGEEL